MANNSDGYIMLDFAEVDFRRTNQTIGGLYKRCVDVIGTNKFILVINANGRTPMPATCSYVNNQYVIDSFIYLFSITSDDNIFIRRNDIPASDIIDDSIISVDKTFSSDKINTELSRKQHTLTAGANITIDENNVISTTGGGAEIDDTVIVNDKVWSSRNTVEKLAPVNTVIGDPATFNTSLALPLVACTTEFMCTQEGSGDPSPSNVRNIVGVDNITLTVNGDSVDIDLDGTRYGGYVDVVRKKLVLTNKQDALSNYTWGYTPVNNPYFSASFAPSVLDEYAIKSSSINDYPFVTTDIYKYNGYGYVASLQNNHIITNGYGVYIHDDRYTSSTDFINNMNSHYIVYELSTPIEIPLSDIPTLSTIIGNNSFACDIGLIKVSYKCLPSDLL